MTSFAITWDYRCPYARNANEHVLAGLGAGTPWEVQFIPFSLDQSHVADGESPVWDEPDRYPGLLAGMAGIVVRDQLPHKFLAIHQALFTARHERSLDLRRRSVIADVIAECDVDPAGVLSAIDEGWPLQAFRKEHEAAVAEHDVFGVPTFISEGQAAFVRLLSRPEGDAELAQRTIDRVIDLITGWDDLNELKHTTVPR